MIALAVIVVILLIIGCMCCTTIPQNYVGLDETFGTYRRTLQPGLHLKVPFMEHIVDVPLASVPITMPGENVITKDNVDAKISLSLNYHITDPIKYEYKNTDSVTSMKNDVEGELRSVIGSFSLNDALASTAHINEEVFNGIGDLTDTFGVKIDRLNITNFQPNSQVLQAMDLQKTAQSKKVAMQQEADGQAQKVVTINNANNQAEVNTSKANAKKRIIKNNADNEAMINTAKAKRQSILMVQSAINSVCDKYLSNKSIDAYTHLANSGNLVVVPGTDASSFGKGIALGKGVSQGSKVNNK